MTKVVSQKNIPFSQWKIFYNSITYELLEDIEKYDFGEVSKRIYQYSSICHWRHCGNGSSEITLSYDDEEQMVLFLLEWA